ncbi:MAG: hypothetical protein U0996_25410 [Planctomycetaceae bacterium]
MQQGKPVPVWGWADPGEDHRRIWRAEQSAVADESGRWRAKLEPLFASVEITNPDRAVRPDRKLEV